MCFTNMVVKEEHVYIDARTFFQNWINGPDRKYFHAHAGKVGIWRLRKLVELRLSSVSCIG